MELSSPQIPVLLFAFANDDGRSLRQLDEEQRALRKIFQPAEKEGEYEIRILAAATAEDVIDTFRECRGRIQIFHYGGHSNEKEIFFKTALHGHQGTNADSLAGFLALQEGLELIFLNSCLSLAQAEKYQKSGIRRVIATSRSIGDFAAREFATEFYKSLVTGADIRQAYWEAERGFQLKFEEEYRSLAFRTQNSEDQFPWRLVTTNTVTWGLPHVNEDQAAGPERSPIRGLLPFESKDAILFQSLQRKEDIMHIRQASIRQDFSIGILTGDSGCGKTSFLQAGLQPALEAAGYCVVYVKFSDALPMERIRQAVNRSNGWAIPENADFLSLLDQIHADNKETPLVFLFDQFEQFFTHNRSKESRAGFIEELNSWYQQRQHYTVKCPTFRTA